MAIAILNPPERHGRTRSLRSARDPNCQVNTVSAQVEEELRDLGYKSGRQITIRYRIRGKIKTFVADFIGRRVNEQGEVEWLIREAKSNAGKASRNQKEGSYAILKGRWFKPVGKAAREQKISERTMRGGKITFRIDRGDGRYKLDLRTVDIESEWELKRQFPRFKDFPE